MSKLNLALDLARMGFHIFPLKENSKKPLIKDFPNQATMDEEKIKNWWLDPVLELERDWNIGISTTRFGEDEALIVIDVDNKPGKNGSASLDELEILGDHIPDTFSGLTPTGGWHLIYRHIEALKQGVNVLGDGLDIRSRGGYIVAPGSIVEAGEYKILNGGEIESAPSWLVDRLGKAPEKSTEAAPENIDQESAIQRAIYYLENEAPESIKGQGGDQTAYRVAARVKDFGVDQNTALELMMDHWFNGSGWTPEKLKLKIEHAYKYGKEVVGSASPEAAFTPIEQSEDAPAEEEHYLKKINKDHALVLVEGSYFVIHETVNEKGDPKRVYLSEQAFKRKFSPYTVQKKDTYATIWLDWANRREYAGICFAPEREVQNNYYNLWRGFSCQPLPFEEGNADQKKGFMDWYAHVYENVANKNEKHFKWILTYLAHMIQKPWERPLTTLVLRGKKGTGKNAVIDRVGNLLGQEHYHVVQDGRYLTSNFNGHMDSCLCLVLDEAIWSGDKSAEGILKGVTTSPMIMIERKGKEPYKVDNLVRLVVIGNDDWLVPASTDERRYGVFDVGEGKMQDRKYFHDMRVNLEEKGGNRILLHFLKNYDLTQVDINEIPKTAGLLDQKLNSLDPLERWWYDCLVGGRLMFSEFGDEWPDTVSTDSFRSAFTRNCRERNIRSWMPSADAMGRKLKNIVPEIKRTKIREGNTTAHVYKFPTLQEARKSWESYVGQTVIWEDL